jgi:hypothetical protein
MDSERTRLRNEENKDGSVASFPTLVCTPNVIGDRDQARNLAKNPTSSDHISRLRMHHKRVCKDHLSCIIVKLSRIRVDAL